MKRRRHRYRGFTLVEILVALAVIAISLAAAMTTLGGSIDTVVALRERTVAMWMAQNRLTLHYVARSWPALETSEGTTEMAGHEWRWREQVQSTPDNDVRRIEIEIRVAPEREAAARLVGFLVRPPNAP
jgi:general secretion pathway protein I